MLEPTQRKFTPDELVRMETLQRQAMGREFDARKALQEIALRQWCVEQAASVCPKDISFVGQDGDKVAVIVVVASDILEFVSYPMKDREI